MVEPGNPGRQAFCATSWEVVGFDSQDSCLADDWYFFGRLVGNSGPGRTLSRESRTQRIAAAFDRDLGKNARLDLAASYSRATGNINFPAEYHYRKFLAFRGLGGPDCGVGVMADATAPAGMALADHDKVAGTGDCMYYNPFSNALQYAQQPGAVFENEANPAYAPGLENSPELLAWINEEVNLDNTATLEVVDATYTREYHVRALLLNGLELQPEQEAAGYLNESIPIVVPIPQWKWRLATGYHRGGYSLVQHLNYISSYEDQLGAVDSDFRIIDPFFTWDLNLLCNLSGGISLTFSALNLTDAEPPLVNREHAHDGLTHSSKGRRFKLAVTYQLPFGGMVGRGTP